jgi:uncharacterized protein YndB with AHSA1/START domain
MILRTIAALIMQCAAAVGTAAAAENPGLISNSEAIHQEITIAAPRSRVYDALTHADQYQQVQQLGVAMSTVLKTATAPVKLSAEPGGAFVLFGGHIVGRNIELVPNVRIVQAWREITWMPGVYSVARFELSDDAKGTRISFDHVGFPPGGGAHLAKGWYENYWEPLRKFLAR